MDQSKALGQYNPMQGSEFQFDPTRQFSGQEVQNYMSPYMQNVVDQQSKSAIKTLIVRTLLVLIKVFRLALSVVLVKALCKVWLKKVLWGSWIKSKLKVYKMPTAKLLLRSKPTVAAQTGDQAARAAEAARVQQMSEASNQFGAGQGIAALGAGAAGAQALAGYGQLGREADIQNAQLLETIGRSKQLKVSRVLILGTKTT
jgi:hypothetical protein